MTIPLRTRIRASLLSNHQVWPNNGEEDKPLCAVNCAAHNVPFGIAHREVRRATVSYIPIRFRGRPHDRKNLRSVHAGAQRKADGAQEALNAIGFFKHSPAAAMRTLRQMAYRAALSPNDVAMLLAIARQTIYVTRPRK